tara:strand:- start:367 stop:468 length:102 start_codon:yes stop_codon:yes gene_type:complete
MIQLELNGNIVEVESTNEALIAKYFAKGYNIVE